MGLTLTHGKEVNTMLDMSSIIDASLAFGGAIAVALIGISMVSSESNFFQEKQHSVSVDASRSKR